MTNMNSGSNAVTLDHVSHVSEIRVTHTELGPQYLGYINGSTDRDGVAVERFASCLS